MPRFAVILPAAGKSSRFGDARRKKPFLELRGRPIWVRAAEVFLNRDDVVQTLIVLAPEDVDWFKEKFRANLAFMNVEIVLGGAERVDSVQNALARVRSDVEFVAVHDAARPLIVRPWVDAVFRAAEAHGAAIPAVPVTNTIKRVDEGGRITETVSRAGLWGAQTPQVARRDWLLDAFARRKGPAATDEAQLLEQAGRTVAVVEGSALNIKITSQEDFRIAEAVCDLLPREKSLDALHPFADERFL